MIASLYRPGDSPLHRLPAGIKLAALPLLGTLLFMVPSWPLAALALAATLVAYRFAQLPVREAARRLRPTLFVLALVFAGQLWFAGWQAGLLFTLRLATLLALAGLVTLTTSTGAIVEALERALAPFRFLGVSPEKVSLAISMVLRFLPMVSSVVGEVREAQAARGIERSVLRLAVPVIVRLLKASDEIAEAIDARS